MLGTFRQSMTWLHTWCGLVFGWVLFAVFFAGTVAVFRLEVDYWMTPELHGKLEGAAPVATAQGALERLAPGALRWTIDLPDERADVLRIRWQPAPRERLQSRYIDAAGNELPVRDTRGGTMIYRFHYGLLLGRTGMWMVGGLAMVMFVTLLTGIIIHAKIFKEFFTFRPGRAPPRAWLDAHTVSSVMSLPFTVMITYTGLVIWWFIWMPGGLDLAFGGDRAGLFREMAPPGFEAAKASGQPASLADLSGIVAAAAQIGDGDLHVATITVFNPGDSAARVELARVSDRAIWGGSDRLRFDGVTGSYLDRRGETGQPAYVAFRAFRILHEIKFAAPWLRWLFFVMSAASCVVIATGAVLWGAKRRARHLREFAKDEPQMHSALACFGVEALNAGVIAGMFTATSAYFMANRIIPAAVSGRADMEVNVFFLVWFACAAIALATMLARCRAMTQADGAQHVLRSVWSFQWALAAVAAGALPLVDQISTGGLVDALARRDPVLLSFHATNLGLACGLLFAAWKASGPPGRAMRLKRA